MGHTMTTSFARLMAGAVLAAAVGAAWAGAAEPGDPIRFEISRFDVAGNTLLTPQEVDAAVAPFTGPERDFGDVQRALEALEARYRERGYSLVTVQLPEQELRGGVVRLRVVQASIAHVTVTGNTVFDEANIRRSLPTLQVGQAPNMKAISPSLKMANENPSKKIKLSLENAEADDQLDARIEVADEKAWRAMVNLDNSGTEASGKTHAGVVLQHANLWGRDHVASLQYTTTVEKPDQVAVWGAGYHIPLYALGDSVDLFASYSNVDSGSVTAGLYNLAVSGKGTVAGMRYNQTLARVGQFEPRLVYGADYKAYRNDVLFAGQNFGNDVTVHPLSIGYLGTLALPNGEANLSLTAVHNIAGGARGADADFARVRSGAKASYSLLRVAGAYTEALGTADWQLRLFANGQFSNDALAPGEQFGAGGGSSVRGFEERALSTDSGLAANAELYTPNLCAAKAGWQCRMLGFYDAAYGSRNHALPGELNSTTISSAGLGLRFGMGAAASAQIDLGHVIQAGALAGASRNKVHIRVGLAY
jgi:hemolysin activation/secretion protein